HDVGALTAVAPPPAPPRGGGGLVRSEPLGVSAPGESDFDRQLKNHRNPFLIAKPEQYDQLLAYTTVVPPAMPPPRKRRRAEGLANHRPFYQLVWSKLLEGDRAKLLDF